LDDQEEDVIATEGGRVSIGDAAVDIPPDAIGRNARVRLRRLEKDQLSDPAAAELASGSEFFEVTMVDLSTGNRLDDSDVLSAVTFSRLLAQGIDLRKVYFKFITPVDSAAPTAGVIDNSAMNFDPDSSALKLSDESLRYRASGAVRHASFIITAIDSTSIVRTAGRAAAGSTTGSGSDSGSGGSVSDGIQQSSEPIHRLSLNGATSCAIDTLSFQKCWGLLSTGVAGASYNQNSETPTLVVFFDANLPKLAMSSIGEAHNCALTENGSIYCWGQIAAMDLNNSMFEPVVVSAEAQAGPFVDLVSGQSHSCAIKHNDLLYCWGDNSQKQLGTSATNTTRPVAVGSASWKAVSAGKAHSCGIQTNGSLWCWGENQWGTIGDGTAIDRAEPTRVGEDNDWRMIGRGPLAEHQCAIKTNGSLWCWGLYLQGQLGPSGSDERRPSQVGSDTDWVYVALGVGVTCGIKQAGSLWCWGQSYGSNPVRIQTAEDWTSVSVGDGTLCGTKTDNSVWCWGRNQHGQVGNGTYVDAADPVKIDGI
jgi:hypothetical protein